MVVRMTWMRRQSGGGCAGRFTISRRGERTRWSGGRLSTSAADVQESSCAPDHNAARRVGSSGEAASFTLNAGETTVSFAVSRAAIDRLAVSIGELMDVFREKEQQTRQTRRYGPLDFKHTTEASENKHLRLEVFCNPNMHPSALNATALVSVATDEMRIVTECALSALRASVEDCVSESS